MTRAVGNWDFTADWSASGGQLVFKRTVSTNRIDWGEDTKGFISRWYGETTSAYMEWAASGDELLLLKSEARIASASFSGSIVVTGEADITSASVTTLATVSLNVTGLANITSASFTGAVSHAASKDITFGNNTNIVLSTVSGTMIGTGSTQKLGFLGATPIVAEKFSISAADIASAMKNFGLFTTTSA